MLQLYSISHIKLDGLIDYKELKVEHEINTESVLSFSYPISDPKHDLLQEECYIRTKDNEYIVKEVNYKDDDWTEYICKINIEGIKGKDVSHFETVEQSCTNSVNLDLVGTGWTIGSCNVTKLRTVRKNNCNAYIVLQEIQSVYGCEMTFDSITKKVYIYQSLGSDKGSYFAEQLNLKKLDVQRNSYDYITRLIPLGKDGLDIAAINGGLNYIENYQYSNKIITAFWEDNRYTDAQSLFEDATARLDYLSKPYKAYKADVIDLANIKPTWIGGRNLLKNTSNIFVEYVASTSEYFKEFGSDAILEADKQYTLSWIFSTVSGAIPAINIGCGTINDFTYDIVRGGSELSMDIISSITFTPTTAQLTDRPYFAYRFRNELIAADYKVKFIKLELGNKATDWSPAPEDNYNQYAILDYSLGDTITLLAKSKNTKEQQRIIKLTVYPDEPERNTCEIANKLLSLEYLQVRFVDISDIVDTVTTVDGLVDGSKVDGIDWSQLQNVHIVIADIQDLSVVTARIGTLETTTAHITNGIIDNATIDIAKVNNLSATYATIVNLTAANANIISLTADKANITDLNVVDAKIINLVVNTAQIGNAQITTAKIALGAITTALIDVAAIGTTQIADGSITDAKVVDLSANSITAGTLSVDRLIIRGAATSLVYAINNISGTLQAQNVNTLNGETLTPRTITADRIVAKAITAAEIAAKTITANEIVALTITAAEIAAGTITATQIAAGTITTNELASTVGAGLNISSNTSITLKADKTYVDAIQIGGRNLIPDSKMNETITFAQGGWRTVNLVAGNVYTFTVNGRLDTQAINEGRSLITYLYDPTWIHVYQVDIVSTTTDVSQSTTFTCTWTGLYTIYFESGNFGTQTGTVTVNWMKLELGNKATDWSPAPEDSPTNANIISAINMTTEAITISANKIGLLGAVNIPDLTADKIVGGTLTLGGVNNISGTMTLLDNTGAEMGIFSNIGINLRNGEFRTVRADGPYSDSAVIYGGRITLQDEDANMGYSHSASLFIATLTLIVNNIANPSLNSEFTVYPRLDGYVQIYSRGSVDWNANGADITISSGALKLTFGSTPYAITRDTNGFLKAM